MAPLTIPATDLATTIHIGPHDDIDVTYAALGTYVSQQALQVAGPCVRSTTSAPAIPMTAPDGARKSAGQSFKLQPERFSGQFSPQNRTSLARRPEHPLNILR